jgi:CRP-like cAMP-binding protein
MEQLFSGIDHSEREQLLNCLQASTKRYTKGELILAADDLPAVGVVLHGSVQVIEEDLIGNRTIIGRMEKDDLFGEALACAGISKMPYSVEATSDCIILLIDVRRILASCPTACPYHARLIENLLTILAQKNITLGAKIRYLSQRSTRRKLLAYLTDQAREAGSRRFEVPFNRQELADYLCVDRSAMSAELSRLKAEGILDYDKNQFAFLRRPKATAPDAT